MTDPDRVASPGFSVERAADGVVFSFRFGTTLSYSVVAFVSSLIVGTVGTYVSATLLSDESSLVHSFVTALAASAVWIGVAYVTGGSSSVIPSVGPGAALAAYIVVIDPHDSGTPIRATAISVLTWAVDFTILYALALAGYSSFRIVGVPPGI